MYLVLKVVWPWYEVGMESFFHTRQVLVSNPFLKFITRMSVL
jgi:hypothetical protein